MIETGCSSTRAIGGAGVGKLRGRTLNRAARFDLGPSDVLVVGRGDGLGEVMAVSVEGVERLKVVPDEGSCPAGSARSSSGGRLPRRVLLHRRWNRSSGCATRGSERRTLPLSGVSDSLSENALCLLVTDTYHVISRRTRAGEVVSRNADPGYHESVTGPSKEPATNPSL